MITLLMLLTINTMSLIEQLITTTCELQRLVNARIRKTTHFRGCTILQLQVLLYISEHAHVMNSDIAENFDITPAAVTQLTERLEIASFIFRTPDVSDHRIQVVQLTNEGKKQLTDFLQKRRNELKSIFSTLNEVDQTQLLRLHETLVQSMKHQNESMHG